MKRTKTILALGLAASFPAAGCATTHLGGAYRTSAVDLSAKQHMHTLDEGSSWPLFWGLFDAGSYDANRELAKKLRPDEEVTNLEVKERLSVGGFFLWLITGGIVSHHAIEVRGSTSVASRPPSEPATGAAPVRERETIVTPAAPAPAGYKEKTIERDHTTGPVAPKKDRSADYNEGYRDGIRDRDHVTITGDGPIKADRSGDYNEGYRDAVQGR
jgi:hypothetical protein